MVRRRVPLVTLALLACGLAVGGLWWWAVLRLLLVPGESGPVEGTVAAGGWGLSLLPVHVAASSGRRGAAGSTGRTGVFDGTGLPGAVVRRVIGRGAVDRTVTRASRRRRWGGGSGRS
ncbi:hypothetical protein GCM10010275_50680 [Streptomyces litmocidini]|uniref:hypothetical protein n=1 Tax=Streptomyces litmocidini TaxID=67318 RepID=UPI00167D6C49|nr:hypothetical protein [Streptomyces litmocidini]GGV04917.1 hypothetical protein GCM10010275_50680 [Streptomyces litmocidini]